MRNLFFECSYSQALRGLLLSSHVRIATLGGEDSRNVDLYPDSILSVAPEGCHYEMQLYPSEEQFNLPSLFVKQGDITGLENKVILQTWCSWQTGLSNASSWRAA